MSLTPPRFSATTGRYRQARSGQSLVECALVLSFVSLLSVVVLSVLHIHVIAVYWSVMHGLALMRGAL